ncbi:MAG: hypothetical protein VXZ96_00070 [Myxococcota bacterium]|nr:hypothetical protein [Myxococcota bacterium]
MPDLAWLYGAYAMMGQMGMAQPVVHRQHIHQQRAPRPMPKTGPLSRRNQKPRPSNRSTYSPPARLAQGPQPIGFNAPTHHIHQLGRGPSVPNTIRRARQRGLGRLGQLTQVGKDTKALLSGMVPVAAAAILDKENRLEPGITPASAPNLKRRSNLKQRPMWTNSAAPQGSATERLIYEYGAWSAMAQVQQARHSPQAVAQQLLRREDIAIDFRSTDLAALTQDNQSLNRIGSVNRFPEGFTDERTGVSSIQKRFNLRRQFVSPRDREGLTEFGELQKTQSGLSSTSLEMETSLVGSTIIEDRLDFRRMSGSPVSESSREPIWRQGDRSSPRFGGPRSFTPTWSMTTQPIVQGLLLRPTENRFGIQSKLIQGPSEPAPVRRQVASPQEEKGVPQEELLAFRQDEQTQNNTERKTKKRRKQSTERLSSQAPQSRGVRIPVLPQWHQTVSGLVQRQIKRDDTTPKLSPAKDIQMATGQRVEPLISSLSFLSPNEAGESSTSDPQILQSSKLKATKTVLKGPQAEAQAKRIEKDRNLSAPLDRLEDNQKRTFRVPDAVKDTVDDVTSAAGRRRKSIQVIQDQTARLSTSRLEAQNATVEMDAASKPFLGGIQTLQWRNQGAWAPNTLGRTVIQGATPRRLSAPNSRSGSMLNSKVFIETARTEQPESETNRIIQGNLTGSGSSQSTRSLGGQASSSSTTVLKSGLSSSSTLRSGLSNPNRGGPSYVSVRRSPQWQSQPVYIRELLKETPETGAANVDFQAVETQRIGASSRLVGDVPKWRNTASSTSRELSSSEQAISAINVSQNPLRPNQIGGKPQSFTSKSDSLSSPQDLDSPIPAAPIRLLAPEMGQSSSETEQKRSGALLTRTETSRRYPSVNWAHQPKIKGRKAATDDIVVAPIAQVFDSEDSTVEPISAEAASPQNVGRPSTALPPLSWRQHTMKSGQVIPRVMMPLGALRPPQSTETLAEGGASPSGQTEGFGEAEIKISRSNNRGGNASQIGGTPNLRLKNASSAQSSSTSNVANIQRRAIFVPAKPDWYGLDGFQRRRTKSVSGDSVKTPLSQALSPINLEQDIGSSQQKSMESSPIKAPQREPRIVQALTPRLTLLLPPERQKELSTQTNTIQPSAVAERAPKRVPKRQKIPAVNWSRQPIERVNLSRSIERQVSSNEKRFASVSKPSAPNDLSRVMVTNSEVNAVQVTSEQPMTRTMPRNLLLRQSGPQVTEIEQRGRTQAFRRGETVMQTASRRFEFLKQSIDENRTVKSPVSIQTDSVYSDASKRKAASTQRKIAETFPNFKRNVRLKRGMPRRVLQTQKESRPNAPQPFRSGQSMGQSSPNPLPSMGGTLPLVGPPSTERTIGSMPPVAERQQQPAKRRTPKPKMGELAPQKIFGRQKGTVRTPTSTAGSPEQLNSLPDRSERLSGIQTGAQMIANSGTGLVEAPGRPLLSFLTPPKKSMRETETVVGQSSNKTLSKGTSNKKNKSNLSLASGESNSPKTKTVIRPEGVFEEEMSSEEDIVEDAPPSRGGISWSAPEAFQPNRVQSGQSARSKSNMNSQVSSSDIRSKAESIEDLAEETILAILTELSSSSPEAQALLDDVYRQVEQIRRLNKFRQI